ncbi:neuronal acetylcholine receptor subunit alpha-5-like [Aphidius gifuensis]|uniref:neuronal acetylcholine receptor subunit alpha-5-like n=1 Tax=Aphidius gifuensis TaxID=684658 RepID=UPI001CDD5EA9|nr:neuronal acetylcholine receptor subunit alpha-5-like [Aphidius gifuensis]
MYRHRVFYYFNLSFFLLLCEIQSIEGLLKWNATWSDKLKRDLLFRYDKFARPTQHYNVTKVNFGLRIYHVSLDEFNSAITVQSIVRMDWTDDKLKWNASNYGGLTKLIVGNHEVWQPDIVLQNSVAGSAIEHYGDVNCIIYSEGNILWVPPTRFIALCNIDLRFWPFDTQKCELKFGSWTFPASQIDLSIIDIDDPAEDKIHLIPNAEWKILEITKYRNETIYSCCPDDPYVHVNYIFSIKRNSPLYTSIFITPTVVIVIMILINFWLPPQSKEKIFLCGCTALITIIYLLFFCYKIPPLSDKAPLIVSFYSGCLYQVSISLIISTTVINLSRKPNCQPLPRNIKRILNGWLGKYLGLSNLIQVNHRPIIEQELSDNNTDSSIFLSHILSDNSDTETKILSTNNDTQIEWILATTAIDRISFLIFVFYNIFVIYYSCVL